MLSDTGANGKDTVDIHAHTSGSRAEYAAGKRIAIVCAAFLLALSLHGVSDRRHGGGSGAEAHHPENHG